MRWHLGKRTTPWTAGRALEQNALVLDVATTGLGRYPKIVELVCADRDGNVLINTLVDPGEPIPRDATLVHGITDACVRGQPGIGTVMEHWSRCWRTTG